MAYNSKYTGDQVENILDAVKGKVDKVTGKQLSTNDYTTAEKDKLAGIAEGADVNVQSDWSATSGDAFIKNKPSLAAVATSGSYNDLSNKPTIPSAVTESTVSGWGFTKNTGTYSKPSTGIPKTDLASAVQTSLGKADTALQSYTEQYKGTITAVQANGTSVATSGTANIPAASTSAYGVTKLSSATNSTSTSLAATASAVKSAYDLANGKQDKLTSGTNIKTINGQSLLGSGDISISGGSGGSSYAGNYPMTTGLNSLQSIAPNTLNVLTTYAVTGDLVVTFGSAVSGIVNEYLFAFYAKSSTVSISLPSSVVWANDDIIKIEADYTYIVSIVNNIGLWSKAKGNLFNVTTGGGGGDN